MVEDGAFIHKIDYLTILLDVQNLEGNLNNILDFALWWSFSGGGSAINGVYSNIY